MATANAASVPALVDAKPLVGVIPLVGVPPLFDLTFDRRARMTVPA